VNFVHSNRLNSNCGIGTFTLFPFVHGIPIIDLLWERNARRTILDTRCIIPGSADLYRETARQEELSCFAMIGFLLSIKPI